MKSLYVTVAILLILGLSVFNFCIPFVIPWSDAYLPSYLLWCSLSGMTLGTTLGLVGGRVFRDRTQVGDFYANSR